MEISEDLSSRDYVARIPIDVLDRANYLVLDRIVIILADKYVEQNGKEILSKISIKDLRIKISDVIIKNIAEEVKNK